MRLVVFCLWMLLALPAPLPAQDAIPRENQIVLTQDECPTAGKIEWVPSPDETAAALAAIRSFLASDTPALPPYPARRKEILGKFAQYKVKFSGVKPGGKRIIHCYFYSMHAAGGSVEDTVDDGGSHFWRIDVDPESQTCTNFSCNGES